MRKRLMIITLASFFVVSVFGQHPSQDKNWEVIFQDDFSSFTNGQPWYKSEGTHDPLPQHYIHANTNVVNGQLVLTAKKENYHCTNPKCNCGGGTYSYTSGGVVSYNNSQFYHYGYYEMYAKLPAGAGQFPAFWLWGEEKLDTNCLWYNEIDIMETTPDSCNLNNVTTSNYREYCKSPEYPDKIAVPHPCNYSDSFHWYGVEWDKNRITWYIDRIAVRQVKHTGMQHKLRLIIGLQLFPDSWGYNCGASNAIFPTYMYIDQVNAYKLRYDCKKVVNEILNYNTFNYAVKKSISLSGVSSLSSGQNVSLRATDFIELKDGFYVPANAELYLDNNPCENTNVIIKKEGK
jgi:beta-glucanase (GH16 family)